MLFLFESTFYETIGEWKYVYLNEKSPSRPQESLIFSNPFVRPNPSFMLYFFTAPPCLPPSLKFYYLIGYGHI